MNEKLMNERNFEDQLRTAYRKLLGALQEVFIY